MGVELNFLVKKKREVKPSRIIVLCSSFLFVLAAGLLYLQWDAATAVADVPEPEPAAAVSGMQGVATELRIVQSESVQYVALYNQLVETLGDTAILRTFDYAGGPQLQVNATFASFEDVAATSDRLQRLPYVRGVTTGESEQAAGGFNAALVIDINENGLRALRGNRGAN